MTIKQCLKRNGWQDETTTFGMYRYMSVDINFLDFNNSEQETQFDITAYDEDELEKLFCEFCDESHFPKNRVISITIVNKALLLEDL